MRGPFLWPAPSSGLSGHLLPQGGEGSRVARKLRHDPGADVSGHGLGCRQVLAGRRILPRLRPAGLARKTVQAAEHVQQRRRDGGWRRDRARAGASGPRLFLRAERPHESGVAEAAERDRLADCGAGQDFRDRQGARLSGAQAADDGFRRGQLCASARRRRSGAGRRRGQSGRGQSAPWRHRQHGFRARRECSRGADRRHRSWRRHRADRRDQGCARPGRRRHGAWLSRQQVSRRRHSFRRWHANSSRKNPAGRRWG